MKSKISLIGVFVLMALVATAWAADVSGKWSGRAGDVDITLNLKASGASVTGTVNNPLAGETPIKDGNLSGDVVSFSVVRTINDAEVKVLWKGKIAGDEIKFTREIQGQAGSSTPITAKRVK